MAETMTPHATVETDMAREGSRAEPYRLLLVEDDLDIQGLVKRTLAEEPFEVWSAVTGADALAMAQRLDFDIAVVDLRLPDVDGIVLVRQFAERLNLPVLVLSGLGEPMQRVAGLEAGADDYLTKPFEPAELIARLRAVLRARQKAALKHLAPGARLRIDNYEIDFKRQAVTLPRGREVRLSDAEFRLLKVLADHPNQVLSRETILALTHGEGEQAAPRSVDIQVTRLRKKLEADPGRPRLIRTVRGMGYMLVADRITPVEPVASDR